MPIITTHELPKDERALITGMLEEAITSNQGMPLENDYLEAGRKPGLASIVPLLGPGGYFPQKSVNELDIDPVRSIDCPEFASQTALALDLLSSCLRQGGELIDYAGNTREIAEHITDETGQSMSPGAVVLAALVAGYKLTTGSIMSDELHIQGICLGSLYRAIEGLKPEVSGA
jgi:hypothetical protein